MSKKETEAMYDPFSIHRSKVTEIFLIRHGDALPGPEELIPSDSFNDLPLTLLGRKQANALAERLHQLAFDAAYSSPLRRCRETATPLLERLGLTATIIPNLKEISFSNSTSPSFTADTDLSEIAQALQNAQEHVVRLAYTTGTWDAVEGSEPSKAFRRRVVTAVDAITQQHIGERVLIFAHGGVINAYIAEVIGLDKDFFFPCLNTSITIVRASSSTHRVLLELNDVGHLLPDLFRA